MIRQRRFKTFSLILSLSLQAMAFSASPVSTFAQGVQRARRTESVETAGAASRAVAAPKTVEELRAGVTEVLRQPSLASALVGVKVVSLDTNRTLFEENASKVLNPASNMKIYTVAAALDALTPDFRFRTSAYARAKPDASGAIRGDLIIYGRGDPTFATRFNDGDYYKAIDDFAREIFNAGVRRVDGDLIGDESYFSGAPFGRSWEWDDLQWYYGAEISALTINDNSLDLFLKPGVREGSPCLVSFGPELMNPPAFTVVNRTTTAARGARRELHVYRAFGSNVLEISGALAADDPGYSASVAAPHPAFLFVQMLRRALERQGVKINGRTRTIDADARRLGDATPAVSTLVEIAARQSPPLSEIAAKTLKPSQNLYTELILRALGENSRAATNAPNQLTTNAAPASSRASATSAELGLDAVRRFLTVAGADDSALQLADGSGLSKSDYITTDATVHLLAFMSRHRYAQTFRDALPVAGVDGTLRNRMKGTPAAGNVHAKTGTLAGVTSLSGYVTSAAGERLAFSVIVNNYTGGDNTAHTVNDAIAVLLASFTGRS